MTRVPSGARTTSGLWLQAGTATFCRTYGPAGVSETAATTWELVPHWPRSQWFANSAANIQYSRVPLLLLSSRTEPPQDDVDLLSLVPPWNAQAGPQAVSAAGRKSRYPQPGAIALLTPCGRVVHPASQTQRPAVHTPFRLQSPSELHGTLPTVPAADRPQQIRAAVVAAPASRDRDDDAAVVGIWQGRGQRGQGRVPFPPALPLP